MGLATIGDSLLCNLDRRRRSTEFVAELLGLGRVDVSFGDVPRQQFEEIVAVEGPGNPLPSGFGVDVRSFCDILDVLAVFLERGGVEDVSLLPDVVFQHLVRVVADLGRERVTVDLGADPHLIVVVQILGEVDLVEFRTVRPVPVVWEFVVRRIVELARFDEIPSVLGDPVRLVLPDEHPVVGSDVEIDLARLDIDQLAPVVGIRVSLDDRLDLHLHRVRVE